MRKGFFAVLLTAVAILLTGCASSGDKDPAMDQPAEDGKYNYENQGLGFEVTLPSSFEYYQTQRKEGGDYTDIEFFVPTSDEDNDSEEVAGYAKPLVVRVFDSGEWENADDKVRFEKIGEDNNSVYTVDFWDNIPEDWREKWNKSVRSEIKESFEF
jgi:hypothetical protein